MSKRRAFRTRQGQVLLGLTDVLETGKVNVLDVRDCPIEPEGHNELYRHVQQFLNTPESWLLTKLLNHVIVKGNYKEYAVILNVHAIPPDLKRQVRLLAKDFKVRFKQVSAMFTVASDYSRYYLPDQVSPKAMTKVFGVNELFLRVDGRPFLFSPLAFSQTNESVLTPMAQAIRPFIHTGSATTILDLYCGFGLFGLLLSHRQGGLVGIEANQPAVVSARRNAARAGVTRAKFVPVAVTPESVHRNWPKGAEEVVVILDPPRQGISEGVIEYIAQRHPAQVLHVFCDIDRIPDENKRWRKGGYAMRHVVPVDMFPATGGIEVLVVYEPSESNPRAES